MDHLITTDDIALGDIITLGAGGDSRGYAHRAVEVTAVVDRWLPANGFKHNVRLAFSDGTVETFYAGHIFHRALAFVPVTHTPFAA